MVDPSEASTKFYKENLNREDLEALQTLTPGEVSKPFAAVDTHGSLLCKLVMLKEVIPTHSANLNEDYKQIEKLTPRPETAGSFRQVARKQDRGNVHPDRQGIPRLRFPAQRTP